MTAGPPSRYLLVARPEVRVDILGLVEYGPEVIAAARGVLDDLARGAVTGKQLGSRNVSGDLTDWRA